jgi:hypothetical protein
MARTVTYTKTSFREPGIISASQYDKLRGLLLRNPNIDLDPNSESFTEHFKGLLIGIGITFIIPLLLLSIFDAKEGIHIPIIYISIIICIFSILRLFMEAPSYATYVKKRNEYFSRMKYAIQNTSSYKEFLKAFYGERLL